MTRRLLLPVVVLLAAIAAACVPVTPPPPPPPPPPLPPQPASQYCAPSVPESPGAYQAAFDNLRRTWTEWASADGAVPVHLPNGSTVWMFGDTYLGTVSSSGAIQPGHYLINNSFVVQNGACFEPLMGGAPLARTDLIPDPAPNQWYWPAGAIVDGGALRVFLMRIAPIPAGFGFGMIQMDLATFSLSTLQLQGITGPVPATIDKPFGTTVLSDGSHVYLYAPSSKESGDEQITAKHYVARAPVGQLTNTSAWTYWNQTLQDWVADFDVAEPMAFTDPALHPTPGSIEVLGGPAAQLQVSANPAGGFRGTAKLLDAFSDDVSAFSAPNPWGPWTWEGRVATTAFPELATYGAATHSNLIGTSTSTLVFNTNDAPFGAVLPPTIANYGPRFVTPSAPTKP